MSATDQLRNQTQTQITQPAFPEMEPPAGLAPGVVFTKPWVTELMLDLAGYTADADLGGMLAVEPAAGDGSFLGPMVRRLLSSCIAHGRDVASTAGALLSYELDQVSADQAREIVRSELAVGGVAPDTAELLIAAWVRTGDYLLAAPELPPADFVIGNPPYIRLESLDATVSRAYRARYTTMVGRADVYVAFFEAALKQLKPNGVCGFICADRWMLNQYGGELRRLITAAFAVETVIELHRADAFEAEVSAYPAITMIRRSAQGTAVVARAEAGIEQLEPRAIESVLDEARAGERVIGSAAVLRAAPVREWFVGADPWPCSSPERLALLKHLEAEFYPLESAGTATRVSIGVATGADDVFLTKDAELVEADRLLPLAMAFDTASGMMAWSGHYLVNPWSERGLVDLDAYPRLRAYLSEHEAQLRGRHVGKKNSDAWFRTIDRVDARLTKRRKLYVADIKNRLNPVLDRGETYPHHNLYFVESAVWDEEVLGGLLLSEVAQFFVECYGVRMRGGYLRFQAQYLRRIRVPLPHEVNATDGEALRVAFRARDRAAATAAALRIYGIDGIPGDEG